ncbi:MAG: hypothetical protein JW820_08265, partial [Spirochaetales bacterium]|nr:hypothetical protein [Spirochaetales bacterium]
MRSAGPRIDRYLRRVAGQSLAEPGELTAVCGGPAADPDSVAGSLAYAFLLHQEQEARSQGLKRLIAPILPIPRAELRLRPEVLTLLEAAEVPPGVLADPESLDLSTHPSERLALVLVDGDGRELPAKLRQRVVEILDHHVPAARLPAGTRRIVAPVGSACTLVAEQILERLPGLLEQRLALLLLGPILLDTVNLDPAAGRATERDWQAAARLREAAGAGSAGLYALLREARNRLEGLSGAELLRRDYKESTAGAVRIGIASLPLSAQEWWSREQDAEACLRGLAERRGL